PASRRVGEGGRIAPTAEAGPAAAGAFFWKRCAARDREPLAMKKAPPAKRQRGQVEGGNAQEGRREATTYRPHRSLGDVASIDAVRRPQREAAHAAQASVLVCA